MHSHGGSSHGGHGGHSGHGGLDSTRRALTVSLVLNAAYLLVEVGAGLYTGSLALLSDAAHMVSDVAALGLALMAAHWARRPATQSHTYGLLRAEVLGAFANAVLLFIACLFIFKEAAVRLAEGPRPIDSWPVFGVATVGLLINLGSAWALWRSDRGSATPNLNIRGALVHMLADALGSVGAMVSALLTLFAGYASADAIASLVIGALVLYGTWGILRDSTHVLLEAAPPELGHTAICEALLSLEGVGSVHDLHIWSIGTGSAGQSILTAHVRLALGASPSDVLARAQELLAHRYRLEHSTLQIEAAEGMECRQMHCGLVGREGHDDARDEHDDHGHDDHADHHEDHHAHGHPHRPHRH